MHNEMRGYQTYNTIKLALVTINFILIVNFWKIND